VALLSAACCTAPMKPPDFSTPKAALLTFHDAFNHDVEAVEFECFSKDFKETNRFDYKTYYEFRQILVDDNPVAAFLFSLVDLEEAIIETRMEGDDLATMWLDLAGERITILFIRETISHLEYDRAPEDSRRFVGGGLMPPLQDLIQEKEAAFTLAVPFRNKKEKRRFHRLRKIVLEKQWKFLDFPFLHENKSEPP
jgi:hypothetical protein